MSVQAAPTPIICPVCRVYNHRYLLTHGGQFRGGDGPIGCLGPIVREDDKKRVGNAFW